METHEEIIVRLTKIIDERKPSEYSEMDVDILDIFYLSASERKEFHDAKMAIQSRWVNLAKEAKTRIARKLALKKAMFKKLSAG